MSASLRCVSVNIERSNHLHRLEKFFAEREFDIACFQELMEHDIPLLERLVGGKAAFSPMTRYKDADMEGIIGVGIISRSAATVSEDYYVGARELLHDFDRTDPASKHRTQSHAVLWCDVEKDGARFRIGTTHFPWTPNGEADEFQRADIGTLLALLDTREEFALMGDFNAPRGGEISQRIIAKYADNVPPRYVTSLDLELHRARMKPEEIGNKMVDYVFTTPGYAASEVALITGVSDHCALVSTITRAT